MFILLLVLLLCGLLLLALELFVIPGFGLVGLTGLAAIVASLVWAASLGSGVLAALTTILAAAAMLAYLFLRRFGVKRLGGLILSERLDRAGGYLAAQDLSGLVGAEGRALTPLRPAGTAELSGVRVAVVTQGEFIPRGTQVRVVLVEGQRVVVEKRA